MGASTKVTLPTTLDVSVTSKAILPTNALIWLRNWATGQWDSVATYVVGTGDTVQTVTGLSPALYVRVDGRIEADLLHTSTDPFSGSNRLSVDQVQFRVRP